MVLLNPGRAVAVEEVTLESCHGKRDSTSTKTMTWQGATLVDLSFFPLSDLIPAPFIGQN